MQSNDDEMTAPACTRAGAVILFLVTLYYERLLMQNRT
jgi:hypothetical protein